MTYRIVTGLMALMTWTSCADPARDCQIVRDSISADKKAWLGVPTNKIERDEVLKALEASMSRWDEAKKRVDTRRVVELGDATLAKQRLFADALKEIPFAANGKLPPKYDKRMFDVPRIDAQNALSELSMWCLSNQY